MGNRKFQIPEEDFVIRKDPPKKEPEVVIEEVKEGVSEIVPDQTVSIPEQTVVQKDASYLGRKNTTAPYTQGRKGQSLPRLHLALTPTNYEYLRVLSRSADSSYSGFINVLLDAIREGRLDIASLYNWN